MNALLRKVRVSQPLNYLATSSTRAVLGALGVESEFVVRHLHRAGTVRCRLPNGRTLTLWSRGDDWVSTQVFWRGLAGYEPETVTVFLRHAARARVVVDVGAYVGFYALLAALANPEARVIALEPHPQAFARLTRNVRVNGVNNVECVQAAAAESEGAATLWGVPLYLPTSSSLSHAFMAQHEDLQQIPVQVLRLETFLRDAHVQRVDLLKIDTETTEPQVLRGLGDVLRRDRPAIICEVLREGTAPADLEKVLGPLGYRYFFLTPKGPIRRDRIDAHPEWLNYLFVTGEP